MLTKVAIIKKLPTGRYRLFSRKKDKSGKRRNLGTFDSLEDAKKREKQVQFFKYHAEDQNSRDKETKALSLLSDLASYLEQAGYIKHSQDLYNVMDAIDNNLDNADDGIPNAQLNIGNLGNTGDTSISSGLLNVPEAKKMASILVNMANRFDKAGLYTEANQIDSILLSFAGLEDEAEEILKEDPTALFEIGPEFFPPHLVKKYIKPFAMKNPFSFFRLKLEDKYPELALDTAKQALINDDEAFFNYSLHKKFPELVKVYMQQLAEYSPKKFFKLQYLFGDHPEFEPSAARSLFRTDKDEFKKLNLDKKYPASGLEDNAVGPDNTNMAVASAVKAIKRDYKDGKFDNLSSAQDIMYMLADRLHMNLNNRQEGGFIAGLAAAMDFIHPQEAFGDPDYYQSALMIFNNPDAALEASMEESTVEEMDNADMLAKLNGLQGTTSIDGGSAGQFAGLSDAYFYQNYENLDHRYKISP